MIRSARVVAILTVLATLVTIYPAGRPRRGEARGPSSIVETVDDFSLAAERAGREDWPDPYMQQPGTAVIIEFEPNRAAITLAADSQSGTPRLIAAARAIAAAVGYPAAKIRTYEDDNYAAAQIDLSQAIHHGWLTQVWDFPLGQTAEALREADLAEPAILAIEPGGAASGTDPARVRERRDIWFTKVHEISPDQIIHFHVRANGFDLAVFVYCAASLLAAILRSWWFICVFWPDYLEPETDPDEGQRRYERGPPYWLGSLSDPILVVLPLCIIWAMGLHSSTAAATLQILLPLSLRRLAIIAMSVAAFSALAMLAKGRLIPPRPDSDGRQPSLIQRAAPLALLLPATAIWIPLLLGPEGRSLSSPAALGLLAWAVLSALAARCFIHGWNQRLHEEIDHGPWYDMAHEVAAIGGMTLKRVLVLSRWNAIAYVWKSGVIGISERLVTYLEPGEVRAMIAVGMAHAQRGDVKKQVRIIRAVTIAVVASCGGIAAALHIGFETTLVFMLACDALLSPLAMMATASISRQQVIAADRQAAEWLGDPGMMARALTSVYTLDRLPTRLRPMDEIFSSYPSVVYRVARLREMARRRNPSSSAAAGGARGL